MEAAYAKMFRGNWGNYLKFLTFLSKIYIYKEGKKENSNNCGKLYAYGNRSLEAYDFIDENTRVAEIIFYRRTGCRIVKFDWPMWNMMEMKAKNDCTYS